MKWKFWSKEDKVLDTQDKYRLKVIILKNGTKKYYPQFKDNSLTSEWLCIIKTHNGHLILVDVSQFDLTNSNYYHCQNEIETAERIEAFKLQLKAERANEYQSEEIIKL